MIGIPSVVREAHLRSCGQTLHLNASETRVFCLACGFSWDKENERRAMALQRPNRRAGIRPAAQPRPRVTARSGLSFDAVLMLGLVVGNPTITACVLGCLLGGAW